jgi:hypothetical protein
MSTQFDTDCGLRWPKLVVAIVDEARSELWGALIVAIIFLILTR